MTSDIKDNQKNITFRLRESTIDKLELLTVQKYIQSGGSTSKHPSVFVREEIIEPFVAHAERTGQIVTFSELIEDKSGSK